MRSIFWCLSMSLAITGMCISLVQSAAPAPEDSLRKSSNEPPESETFGRSGGNFENPTWNGSYHLPDVDREKGRKFATALSLVGLRMIDRDRGESYMFNYGK